MCGNEEYKSEGVIWGKYVEKIMKEQGIGTV